MPKLDLKPSLSEKTATVKCENRKETFSKMKTFFDDQRFCDVDLIAGLDNFRISAHRIILLAASEYFLEVLQDPEVTDFVIAGVNGETLKILLNFIYTTTIEISSETIHDIMNASSFLKLSNIEAECSQYLSESIELSNCLSLAATCKKNNYNKLFERAIMYAARNFVHIIEEEEFLELDVEYLRQLLKRDDLCVRSEEEVFHGIMRWIAHDKPGRECHCLKLLSHLRFPLLTPEFIVTEVSDALPAPECQAVIMKALKWHMSPANRSSLFEEALCKPRNQRGEVILLKGGTEEEVPLIADVLDLITGNWHSQEWPINEVCGWYTNGIHIEGKVFLACTVDVNNTEVSCVQCFNLTTKEWSNLPKMTKRRFSFGMVELNGHLYAVGGHNGSINLCSVERLDLNSLTKWQEVTPMLMERSQPGVVAFNGLLYAFGSNSDFEHTTFEFYDPQTNTWAELTPPSEARIGVGLCVVKGLLYAVGGFTNNGICTMVERYDFQTDSWTEISPSGLYQQYIQCISWKNRLLLLVDMAEGDFKHIIEEYNPETNEWRTIQSFAKDHGTAILISI
ncbi:kelch-like protein 1 [Eupeodes corollae]|uniref:kelch-like protein 1 n=1 Tax=Eupeodes corollae TaxID=290404 RepID=UPI002492AA62|nr:kelch-like protein 1 [Eupeodes corollae]